MRISTLSIGPAPTHERCAQTRVTASWLMLQQLEATTYRAALIAIHGLPPAGVHMPVRTYPHDFGSYAALEVRFQPSDEAATRYAAALETGLTHWVSANFAAPVTYDDRSQPQAGTVRDANACIICALVTCRRLIADGYATDRERSIVTNLTAAFPSCARLAGALLEDVAGCA